MRNTKELFLMVELLIEVPNALAVKKTITAPLKNTVSLGDGAVAIYKNENEQDDEYTRYVFYPNKQYAVVDKVSAFEVERMKRYRYRSYASLPKHFRKHNVMQKLYR